MRQRLLAFLCGIVLPFVVAAQSPVPMASQPMLQYLETFDNIISWTSGFSSGVGANRFAGVPPQGTAAIPDATRTTHNTITFASGSSGGVQKDSANGRMLLLATGTSDNTTAAAVDFFMNFTGATPGTLSFDWASVNNGASSSNRKSSLRVYGSIDGITFTEIVGAQVLNFTNFSPTSGSVVNVPLPGNFTNAPNARLRFYCHNGSGGSSGSRPMIALDNIKVTASGTPCNIPAAQPTNLVMNATSATTISGSFTAATPGADVYLVVITTNNALTSLPVDSFVYQPGDNVGDGTVVQISNITNFTVDSLDPSTTYKVFVFALNMYCTGKARYRTINPANATVTTPAGPPCTSPGTQPTNLLLTGITTNTIQGSFTPVPDATEYLVVASLSPALNATPVAGQVYNVNDQLGAGFVVHRGAATNFTADNLTHGTTYYFFVFALNNYACSNGPAYNISNPLTGNATTSILLPCTVPDGSATNLVLQSNNNTINGYFSPHGTAVNSYLVVMSSSATLSALPADGTVYNLGDNLGGGTIISKGDNYSFHTGTLQAGSTWHFFVFPYNDLCLNGPLYRTFNYLTGNVTVKSDWMTNYYFGNLHAHSSYSDGNKDNSALTPANNYDYAKNALCMDFLGISEHNHFTATNNPGMLLPKYAMGINEANAFNNANPNFLAMYGMEWGVISNGGHVLVYGVPQLMGWEIRNGAPNYDIFVAKSDYLSDTGLFRKVNGYWNNNAFASLAHPSWSDYQNLINIPYSPRADSAISAVALESGPAFSTNTSYSDPGSNMQFLPYYQQLLAKGYQVAPIIDHDNHNTNFGSISNTRTAVIASSLSEQSLLSAVKNMRCYATQDCDTRIDFRIYGQEMGSDMEYGFAPAINVTAYDPTSPNKVPVVRIYAGVPGNNQLPVQIASDTGFVVSFTDHNMPNNTNAYYYADVLIGSKRSISAPIWYNRADPPVVSVPGMEAATASRVFSLLQNPVTGGAIQLQSNATRPGIATFHVQHASGQQVRNGSWQIDAGRQPHSVDVRGLATGVYLLQIQYQGLAEVLRVVIP